MNYIRTKDTEFGLGAVLEVLQEGNRYFKCKFKKRIKVYTKKEIVLKQSDTIEELCDEFVYIYGDNYVFDYAGKRHLITIYKDNGNQKPYIWFKDKFRETSWHLDEALKEGTIIGAIWTDSGLKYVAKMNKKGAVELLCD